MVTKGYQKGVYDRVTEGIGRASLKRCKLAPIEISMRTLEQRRRSNQLISNIDIAGFLSVLVVVLYIVMSPYVMVIDRHGKNADLPYVCHPISMSGANRDDAIIVVIERDGRVWVGDDIADLTQVPVLIQEQIQKWLT
jgi:biopolymer transport protein ExbD